MVTITLRNEGTKLNKPKNFLNFLKGIQEERKKQRIFLEQMKQALERYGILGSLH